MLPDLRQSFNRLRAALRRVPACPPVVPPVLPACSCPLVQPDAPLPAWVADDPVVRKYRTLLGDLPWHAFPERPADRPWPGPAPARRAPFVAAYLIKLHAGKRWMADLHAFLREHPALAFWLGFTPVPDRRQFARVLRTLPNDALAFLRDATVHLLQATLPPDQQPTFGDTIAGDTQALLAWVKENNPKQCIKEGRLDKTRQPKGDPDCTLGVKGRSNRATPPPSEPPTPTSEGTPAPQLQVGVDIFWGYAAGVVATRLPDGTEVVLAERTRPFHESDPSHFQPLMAQVEARLGRRPRCGAWDAAFDAHYVYDYFHQAGGFAAVPFNPGPRGASRTFAPDGRPLCAAGLPMTLQFTYQDRTSGLVPHERAKYRCPLLHPTATGEPCPTDDSHFASGGCTTTLANTPGARIRHELDRSSEAYLRVYRQRPMVERINSQAEALGILRPKLRRGAAIANQNTLIYVLINLRALARLRAAAEEGRPSSRR